MKPIVFGQLALATLGFVAFGTVATAAPLHMEERAFLLGATAASNAQIELGQLAVEKAQDERVREFAQDLLDHHEDSAEDLADLAGDRGVTPVQALEPAVQHWLDRLQGLEGAAFDAVYVSGQVPTLYNSEWIYTRETRHGMDPAVQAVAEDLVAANDAHHDTAQELAAELEAELPDGPHPEDATFLVYAMNVDLSQVRLAELAVEKAEDEQVREFARRMIDEHSRSLEGLTAAAEARGIAPLEETGPVAQQKQDHLAGLPGAEFDWDYVTSQVIDHYEWFYRYEHESIHGSDQAVQELAAEGAEMGQRHHDTVLAIVHDQMPE